MRDNLRPYPEYKDSGVDWLGDIPAHWSIEKVKRHFRHVKFLNQSRDQTNVLSLTLRGVVNNDPDSPEGLVPKDYATYQLFEKGDLVFKLIDLENLRTSRVGLVHENGIMSSAYVRLVSDNAGNIRYFYHQFYDLYLRGVYNSLGAGVRSTLGPNDLLNVLMLIPPPDEQAAIVAFLDAAEYRIRRYIRVKQKLIKLLNEQKQAIIQQAVTRGLNPDAPMKDSGVAWLGAIPSHWELIPNRGLFKLKKNIVGSRSSEYDLLSLTLRGVILRDLENMQGKFPASFDTYQVVEPQDFVFCFFDVDETPRTVGLSEHHGMITGAYTVMEATGLADPRYMYYYYLSLDERKALKPIYRGLRKTIPTDSFLVSKSPLPPPDEQAAIARFLETVESQIQPAIIQAQQQIDLIREYRTRLIADVVTGKVDVRGLAFELPEAFDEDDLLDVAEDEVFEDDDVLDDVVEIDS
jgi:type I restriction enzyme, S subunit